jgi:hypothetical protein
MGLKTGMGIQGESAVMLQWNTVEASLKFLTIFHGNHPVHCVLPRLPYGYLPPIGWIAMTTRRPIKPYVPPKKKHPKKMHFNFSHRKMYQTGILLTNECHSTSHITFITYPDSMRTWFSRLPRRGYHVIKWRDFHVRMLIEITWCPRGSCGILVIKATWFQRDCDEFSWRGYHVANMTSLTCLTR